MATTIHHNPVLLQQQQQNQEDEDIALANYLSTSLRLDQRQVNKQPPSLLLLNRILLPYFISPNPTFFRAFILIVAQIDYFWL